jgi:hypothetical protein
MPPEQEAGVPPSGQFPLFLSELVDTRGSERRSWVVVISEIGMTAAVNESQIHTSITNHSHTQHLLYNRIGLGDYSVPDMGHHQVIAPGRENTQKLCVQWQRVR